jgi:hypothetical protein
MIRRLLYLGVLVYALVFLLVVLVGGARLAVPMLGLLAVLLGVGWFLDRRTWRG